MVNNLDDLNRLLEPLPADARHRAANLVLGYVAAAVPAELWADALQYAAERAVPVGARR
jgi:hypothetical protein